MKLLMNPLRGCGIDGFATKLDRSVGDDPSKVLNLLAHCPAAKTTPLHDARALAEKLGIASVSIKDERGRMGLGSFKALGAAFAIAKMADEATGADIGKPEIAAKALTGQTFVTASAGNHGLSVAAGSRVFGAQSVIYLAQTVPSEFADRLRSYGAKVVVEGKSYEASMTAAQNAAAQNGWTLLSDSTWAGYSAGVDVMEGYLAMAAEAVTAMNDTPPTHVFLQAGVGGLAAAVAVYLRREYGSSITICVVEPESAPALIDSIIAGKPVHADGPVSVMGRLDCKEPSWAALEALAREADAFMTLSDDYVVDAIAQLDQAGLTTSASGGAGYAGLCAAAENGDLGLNSDSRVLLFLSEGPADD